MVDVGIIFQRYYGIGAYAVVLVGQKRLQNAVQVDAFRFAQDLYRVSAYAVVRMCQEFFQCREVPRTVNDAAGRNGVSQDSRVCFVL